MKRNIMNIILKKSLLAGATLAIAASSWAGNITVKGSDTLVILAQKWAEVYMKSQGRTVRVDGNGRRMDDDADDKKRWN